MTPQRRAPNPIPRPALARFIWERGLNWKEAGEQLGMSGEALRLSCLPFADPNRTTPGRDNLQRIFEWSGGEITPDSFHQLDQSVAA